VSLFPTGKPEGEDVLGSFDEASFDEDREAAERDEAPRRWNLPERQFSEARSVVIDLEFLDHLAASRKCGGE
jgi:hypothetical protein